MKTLEQQYMREQLRRAGTPGPRVLGLDDVSITKGHTYRIVVSDLVRQRPIWFGGTDRSEASLDHFYTWLGARKTARIRLVLVTLRTMSIVGRCFEVVFATTIMILALSRRNALQVAVEPRESRLKPFIWTKTANEILASVARFCHRISDSGHGLPIGVS